MCLVLHYPRRCGGLNPITALQSYQYQKRRHELLKGYRSILVASASMYREFEQHGVERDRLNLVPLPNTGTVETETHSPNLDAQTARILFVGRLTDLKGVDHLIRSIPEAARKLGRRVLLTVAGDGPERSRLENLARTIGTPVEFRGWVDSDAKIELMHQSDLLAVPSLWPEPFGLVGLEAGSLGLPAVGYSSGGIPDWLMPGQTGELAPSDPPTIQGLSNAIVRALEYPEHYAQLCRGARELARQFSTERHLSKLEAALQAACSNESDRKATIDLTIGNGVTQ
jgi:glycosyltransferase involved in cell wall biosynthesis